MPKPAVQSPPFRTEDLWLAAAITSSGPLVSDFRERSKKRWEVVFDDPAAHEASRKYMAGELFVDARRMRDEFDGLMDVVKGAQA